MSQVDPANSAMNGRRNNGVLSLPHSFAHAPTIQTCSGE